MGRRSDSRSTASGDPELRRSAEMAARGNDEAFDRLFGAVANGAWGLAFAATDSVTGATSALAGGIVDTLQSIDNGIRLDDVRYEVLQATHSAAMAALAGAGASGAHAREPVSLLGETKDRQATLAFVALPEPARSVLWLVEAEHFSVGDAASVVGLSFKSTDEVLRRARTGFRRYYVDSVPRDDQEESCRAALDDLAAYAGSALNAGRTAAIEDHLRVCDGCREVAVKLDDLERRLQDAVPPLPAWARQSVADWWAEHGPRPETPDAAGRRFGWPPVSASRPTVFATVAALALLAGSVAVGANGVERKPSPGRGGEMAEATSTPSKAVAPPSSNVTTTTTQPEAAPEPPPPSTSSTTTTTTTVPPTTAAPSPRPTTNSAVAAPRTTQARVTAPRPEPTTTTAPTTTAAPVVTQPPTTAPPSYELIDLPPQA